MQRVETIRRVQVGIVGLATVLALLVIGSAIMSRLRTEPAKPPLAARGKPSDINKDQPAKLGIAPADVQENISQGAKDSIGR